MNRGRHSGIIIAGVLMIIFGIAEIWAGLSGNFLGVITTKTTSTATDVAAITGAFYSLAGISVLTMRRWGAMLGIIFIGGELIGRTYLVASGLYSFSGVNADSFVAGAIIAVIFALYIALRWNRFG